MIEAGKTKWRERLSTVDLLVITTLEQLIFMLKIVFTLLEKQATSRGGQMYLAFPFQLVFPDPTLRQYYKLFSG